MVKTLSTNLNEHSTWLVTAILQFQLITSILEICFNIVCILFSICEINFINSLPHWLLIGNTILSRTRSNSINSISTTHASYYSIISRTFTLSRPFQFPSHISFNELKICQYLLTFSTWNIIQKRFLTWCDIISNHHIYDSTMAPSNWKCQCLEENKFNLLWWALNFYYKLFLSALTVRIYNFWNVIILCGVNIRNVFDWSSLSCRLLN